METSTTGNLSRAGFSTARPVRGLIFDGKSSASGPYVTDERRGWGVEVFVGSTVAVGARLTVAAGVSVWIVGIACVLLHAVMSR